MPSIPQNFQFEPTLSHCMEVTHAVGPEAKAADGELSASSFWDAEKGLNIMFDLSPNTEFTKEQVRDFATQLNIMLDTIEGK